MVAIRNHVLEEPSMTTTTTGGMTRAAASGRVDTIGWGLLFVAIGAVSLVPAMPDGAWLIAAGIVMLAASAVHAWMGLHAYGTTIVVGVVALSAGIFTVAGLTTEVGPLVLIVLGLALVFAALHRSPRSDVAQLASTS
jgi:hypothetical protein